MYYHRKHVILLIYLHDSTINHSIFRVNKEELDFMNKDELMKTLHDYTPWELLHRNRRQDAKNMEPVNLSLEVPITDAEKSSGLHLPRVPDLNDNTFSSDIFFCHAPE